MIELQNISKFHNDNPIIDNVSLKIKQGEIVAIIGPSGGGKSTLLRCINFLEIPEAGRVIYNEEEVTAKNANKIRTKIGMVFQGFNLFPHMSVLDNICYAPINILGESPQKAKKHGKELLKKVGLANKADLYPNSLSGGQKQRVAIARSLAMNPEVILFDEPTSALDPEMTAEVLEVIKSFSETGLTIIIVSHLINFAKDLADRVIFLDHGKVVEDAPCEKFFQKPKSKRVKDFLSKIY